jgi:hypothetical protein
MFAPSHDSDYRPMSALDVGSPIEVRTATFAAG